MSVPSKITFRNFSSSPAVEQVIREHIDKLSQLFSRIAYCDVVVEAPHRRAARHFHVRIALGVPGKELVVAHDHADHAHRDVYLALRDAFEAARRQLDHYTTMLDKRRSA